MRSPQQPPAPVSKRDKRRTALQERLQDLNDVFGNSRDAMFRQQIHTLQVEMALIANARPYGLEPLNDAPEEIARLVEQVSSMNQLTPDAAIAGKWYSRFLQEINQTKEEKDAELAALMVGSLTDVYTCFVVASADCCERSSVISKNSTVFIENSTSVPSSLLRKLRY